MIATWPSYRANVLSQSSATAMRTEGSFDSSHYICLRYERFLRSDGLTGLECTMGRCALRAFLPLGGLPKGGLFRRLCLRSCVEEAPLHNARDLSYAAPKLIRRGLIYRGSSPTLPGSCKTNSTEFLASITHFIDLRSKEERARDPPDELPKLYGGESPSRLTALPLMNKRRVLRGLVSQLSLREFTGLATRIVVLPFRARRAIVRRMDAGGLPLLNRIIVCAGGKPLVNVLRSITEGAEGAGVKDRTPRIYLYCTAGKDRTGLVSAFLLSLLGVPRDRIIKDYAHSDSAWKHAPPKTRIAYCDRLVKEGLSADHWVQAPPYVMKQTLEYIDETYGSVSEYLAQHGFDIVEQQRLRNALSP